MVRPAVCRRRGGRGALGGLSIHQHLDRLAATKPAGADGLTICPICSAKKTPIHDPDARGVIEGLTLVPRYRPPLACPARILRLMPFAIMSRS